MNTVGPDGRTQYYRLTPAEAIEALKSHKMGLTNAEARRRLERDGPNTLPASTLPVRGKGFRQGLALAASTAAVAGVLAIYAHQPVVAGILLVIATLYAFAMQRLGTQLHLPPLNAELVATKAHVLRNGTVATLDDPAELAMGDIVHLTAGDAVPADMRLLIADDLLIDEHRLTGEHGYARKYTHALGSTVPVFARHNLALYGTKVVAGDGYGIVTGIGAETELGLTQALAATINIPAGPLERQVRSFVYTATGISMVGTLLACWLAWRMGITSTATTPLVIALLVAIVPFQLLPLSALFTQRTRRLLTAMGVRMKSLYTIDRLRGIDILLLDTQATAESTTYASRVMIGHTLYTVSGENYAPTGTIATTQGKRLTKASLAELSLFFEATALSHHTAVLAPGAGHTDWSVHGNHLEGALLTVARRAGLQTETLRDKHALLQAFHLDHHRHIASSVRQYGDDRVVFAYGQPESVLAQCQKLWDHGHVRAISDADRSRFAHHHIAAIAEGLHTVALAYRVLPKRTAQTLTSDKAEEKLIFLGFVDVAQATHSHLQATLQAARDAGVKVSLLSGSTPRTYAIDSEHLRSLTDGQVLDRLRKGTATFVGLAAEDKIRLVRVAQAHGLRVALTGTSLADTPALLQANIGVALLHAPKPVRSAASLQTENTATLLECSRAANETIQKLDSMFRTAMATSIGLASLAILSGLGSLVFYLPLAITAPRILALAWIVYPLFVVAGSSRLARTEDALEAQYMRRNTLLFGLFAGGFAFASFLMYFGLQALNPAHIASASRFSLQASSVALATLVLCQLMDVVLNYDIKRLNYAKLAPLVLALAIFVVMIYAPVGQHVLMLSALHSADWLVVIGAAILYAAVKLFERSTRHHARHTIIKLHHETFGRTSSAKI